MLFHFRLEMPANPIENPIDESSGLLRTKLLTNIDSFIHCDFGWNILAVEKLVDGNAEDVPIDPVHAAHLPMFGLAFNEAIDFIIMVDYAPDEAFTKTSRLLI